MTRPSYNRIAGQSVERLASLSDNIFAVAMTLLVLDLHTPASHTIHSEGELWHVLAGIVPQLVMFAMSFLTLGIFWIGHQTQLNHFAHSDRYLTWIHIGIMFAVSMVPFSTHLLADFVTYRAALLVYWFNIMVVGILLFISWTYATRAKLMKENIHYLVDKIIRRRILISQLLYAIGTTLCVISTYWSIAFIVCLQLYYALAPAYLVDRHISKVLK